MFDVAIVGFGPSGAAAAALLGAAGLRVHVCDAQRAVYDKPRAIALDHEILRLFQQIGVAAGIAPHIEPFTDSRYLGVDGQLIKCMTTVPMPYPLAHPPSVVFSQPAVEQVLRDRVRSLPNVELVLGREMVDLTQDERGVTLRLRDVEGDVRCIVARHVIGCDGASSDVRRAVGIELEDLGFDEPWLVVDVLANARGLARLPKTSMQYCDPERPSSYVIGPKNHRRWEISLKEGEDPQYVATREGAWRLLSRWIAPDEGTLWRQASYRFHALVAERWRVGRVFIAGDAAHQQPPFLGQGLCQGMRDVANLSWKLIAVHEGRAGDALLDTYGRERGAHVRQLTARIKDIGAVICERDPVHARARDASLLADCGGVVQPEPRQNVQPRLESGLLESTIARGGDDPVGTLFPQPWIVDGGTRIRLDELVGTGWWLVVDGKAAGGYEAATDAAPLERLNLRTIRIDGQGERGAMQEAEGVVADWFLRHRCAAAIVRPDHYVHAVANSPDESAEQLLRLCARLVEPENTMKETSP